MCEPAPLFKVDPHQVEELLDAGKVSDAVDALLNLDELDRDTETRAAVHSLVTRLGHIAASPKVDIMSVVGPYIDALLEARQAARVPGDGRSGQAEQQQHWPHGHVGRAFGRRCVVQASGGQTWTCAAARSWGCAANPHSGLVYGSRTEFH